MPRSASSVNRSRDALPVSGRASVTFAFYAMAFVSGFAALVYELTWAKMLALAFGGTTQATAAVVAGFLGGMGVGAWAYRFLGARIRRPVLAYAALEIGIALTTAALTATLYALPGVLAPLGLPTAAYAVLRFVVIFLLLLGPSMLIGATFPALCAIMIRTAGAVDRRLGWIYGVNTIGAAIGVLVSGLVLTERLGLTGTVRVANVLNIAVGVAALALMRSRPGGQQPPATPDAERIPTSLPRAVTGLVLFGSGFCTLAYEIVWFRAMRYLTGTSTYAFTTILFTFLVGLGLGSLLLRRVTRWPGPERALAWCQCLVAVLALLAMVVPIAVHAAPGLVDQVSIFSGSVRYSPWWQRLLIDAGLAVTTMLPATIFMGLSFPLATRLYLGDVARVDARVGAAYLLANLGSILGAVAGSTLLLPYLGTLGATKATALVNVALGALVVIALRGRAVASAAPVAGAAVVVGVLLLALPGGVPFRSENIEGDVRGRVVFTEEGDLATVQVIEHPDTPAKRAMTIDGYKIGWSEAFRGTIFYRKQVLLAHLPMVLDRRVRHSLNIGLGSSATLRTLASYPQIDTLHCVEINAGVVRGATLFAESAVLADPRVEVRVDDAVHDLLRTDRRYDLIISDGKQDPLSSGNAALLSREFYRSARNRLSAHGMFVQWIPLGSLHGDFTTTLRTLAGVFPQVDVFYFPPSAVLMVGGMEPLADRPRLSPAEYARSPAGRDLGEYLLPTAGAVLAHWTAGRRQLVVVAGDGPTSTWDHLTLEFTPFKAPAEAWFEASGRNLDFLIRAEQVAEAGAGPRFLPEETPFRVSTVLVRRANLASLAGDTARARALATQALTQNPGDPEARLLLDRLDRE